MLCLAIGDINKVLGFFQILARFNKVFGGIFLSAFATTKVLIQFLNSASYSVVQEGLNLSLILNVFLILCAKCPGKNVNLHTVICAFAGQICNKCLNLKYWQIYDLFYVPKPLKIKYLKRHICFICKLNKHYNLEFIIICYMENKL